MARYYSLPFAPDLMKSKEFSKTNAESSVRQNISLLLNTMPGSFRFSPFFGSMLNKHHYHLPDKRKGEKKLEQELKDKFQQNLRILLDKYEPRLIVEDLEVTVKFSRQDEIIPELRGGWITFKIQITGNICGRESFLHSESIYLK